MVKYMGRLSLSLPLVLALAVGACRDSGDDQLAMDTSLNRDLELANLDTMAQPELTDVPAAADPAPAATAPAPRATTPARTPAPRTTTPPRTTTTAPVRTTPSGNTVTTTPGGDSESRAGVIPAGSTINLSSGSRICTNTHRVGQTFTATVSNTVTGSNGAAIPAGATATVEITSLSRSENVNDPIDVGLRVRSVTFGGRTYPVSATTSSASVERVRSTPASKDAQKVATGAVIGAIAGQILGKDTRSTVAGAAVGAAAGAGTAAATGNYEGCVPTGGRITITLNSATEVLV
ncbi:MAG TPA: hypothetical protein VMM17_05435 [Gemmatimonadaceae bacterium]|nr:hypothetical protein [Gemmatimonadaceae bacterium]